MPGGKRIAPFEKGNTTRTMLHAGVANEFAAALNAFYNGKVVIKQFDVPVGETRAPFGKFIFADGNVVLELNIAKSLGSGGTTTHFPWEITVDGNDGDGWKAHVRPGTVNSLVPSNIFDPLDIAATGTYYIKLQCDTDGMTPNDVTVLAETTPVDAATLVTENTVPPTFFDILGIIVDKVVYQVRFTNLTANPTIDFLAPQTPASPGDEAFVRWWKWAINVEPS